jgi:hydroxyacylglutathione hydrolase
MIFHRRTVPGLAIHSYLIGDEKAKECIVIDPVRDVEEYIDFAEQHGLHISHIVETHVHADFVSGSRELKAALDGKPTIHCSGMGGKDWTPVYADQVVQAGDEIVLESLSLKAVHTPGHTPEHLMWVLYENSEPKMLFTGDFLFVGSVGRPDLLGKEATEQLSHQLYHTVFKALQPYPDQTEVCPAHGAGSLCGKALSSNPSSLLGIERLHNPLLQKQPEDKWIEDLMDEMPPVPNYFLRMKKVNVVGPTLVQQSNPGKKALSPQTVSEWIEKGAVVLDVRSKEAFTSVHLPKSINIPFSYEISSWAGWLLDAKQPIILLLDGKKQLQPVIDSLLRVGFDQILGFLKGGIDAWEELGFETLAMKMKTSEQLHQEMQQQETPYVLDIRTLEEWKWGHIEGAHHIHGGTIHQHLDQIPKNRHVSVICASGFRSSIVTSALMRQGYFNVFNVIGGIRAWKEKGYSLVLVDEF